MKKTSELSSVELQIILLAHCNITVSARTISSQWNALAFSTERVIAFSMERILVQNAFQLTRNFGVPLAFLQHSISRSICVPVTRSLLGYFCLVLYTTWSLAINNTKVTKHIYFRVVSHRVAEKPHQLFV